MGVVLWELPKQVGTRAMFIGVTPIPVMTRYAWGAFLRSPLRVARKNSRMTSSNTASFAGESLRHTPVPRITSTAVRARMSKSSHSDQFSMYSRSHRI